MATTPFITSAQADKKIQDSYFALEEQIDIANAGSDLGLLKLTDTPPPTGKHRGDVQTAGTYTNFGGIVFTQEELDNNYGFIYVEEGVSGKVLSAKKEVELSQTINPAGTTKATSEKAVAEYIKPLKDWASDKINYIDNSTFQKGYVTLNGLFYTVSDNWIGLDYRSVPADLKGKEVTLSGIGNVPGGNWVINVKDIGGNSIFNIVGNGSTTPTKHTFTFPIESETYAISITSSANIGLTPQDNAFVGTVMLTLGNIVLPYMPFGKVKIDALKIDNPDKLKFTTGIVKDNYSAPSSHSVAVFKESFEALTIPSPNIINYLTDFEAGYISNTGATVATVNWIRIKKKMLSNDVLSKLVLGEDMYLTISGGGNLPQGSSASLISFYDQNSLFISGVNSSEAASFPLTIKIPLNAVYYRSSITNDASNGGIGNTPLVNGYTSTYQVEIGQEVSAFSKFGEVFIDGKKVTGNNGESNSSYDTSEILIKKVTNARIDIFFHIGGSNNNWFRIEYYNQVNVDRFIDVWRLDKGYICTRNGNESFSDVQQVINTGVYENAIYTSGYGYDNALGSAHGWEMVTYNTIFIDAKKINMTDDFTWLRGNRFFATTKTNLMNPTGTIPVAVSNKMWTIENNILTIENNIKWDAVINILTNSYLSMCSVLRKDVSNNQITHSAMANDDTQIFNVAEPGFTTDIYSNQADPRRTSLVVWGDFFKARMTVKSRILRKANGDILPLGLADAGMQVQNVSEPNYNKLYGKFGSTTTAIGDNWNNVTEYLFSNLK